MKRKVWKLMDRPEGLNFEEALSLVEEDLESPSNNKMLIKPLNIKRLFYLIISKIKFM